ncbi:hypothetical protein SERLA73DRAFT_131630, partial [Serpula lacrymans var. lacrymans S7.3]
MSNITVWLPLVHLSDLFTLAEKQRKISHIQSEDADREKLGEYQRDRERMGREASGQEGILKASGMEEKV